MPLNKDVGNWIKDFMKSDAPQFKGKSKEERKDMALAAYREKYGSLEEASYKKGDKVTYLDHPGEITSVEDTNGKTYVSISYDKGNGKTKVRGILATSGDIKPLKEEEGATAAEEDKFHRELDKLVHKTFGHSSDEKKKMKEIKEKNSIEGSNAENDLVKIFMVMVKNMVEKEENPTPESFNKAKQTILNFLSRENSPLHMATRFVKNEMGILEGAKPDFLDLDKDGNTTEPMKKAAKDKAVKKAIKKVSEVIKVKSPEEAAKVNKLDPDAEVVVDPKALTEGRNYDYEGKMAHSQLLSIVKNARDLFNMISQDSQLKSWVQSKLTKAEDYLDSVRTYLEGESLGSTAPAMFENEAIKDETGVALSIGDVVKGGDGRMYQIIYSYSEGVPMMVPFDLKRKKTTSLRDKIYFSDQDTTVNKKLSKVLDFSATKGGFMK